ncbi:ComF family protein [Patescibacteria group bacterium]|nr:ComF family protein [Patescibacteria group bacterium]
MMEKIKKFLLDILFPRSCFSCGRGGSYLCEDCQSILEISQYQYCLCKKPKRLLEGEKCPECQPKILSTLYFALSYQNPLIKELIQKFKYNPFIKELAKPLASLIITHFQLLNNKPNFSNFILIPIPLNEKRLRWRGFNQTTEISKELSKILEIPLVLNCLIKIKETLPQVKLSERERKENVKETFSCQNQNKIFEKRILLVDDIYTSGATMEEAARVLKKSGAKEIQGVVVARE